MEATQKLTKNQEVWRINGRFAKAPEPVIEPTQDVKKDDGSIMLASTLLGSATLVFAIVFWKMTISIVAGSGVVYLIQRYVRDRQGRTPLVVNEQGKSTTIYL